MDNENIQVFPEKNSHIHPFSFNRGPHIILIEFGCTKAY